MHPRKGLELYEQHAKRFKPVSGIYASGIEGKVAAAILDDKGVNAFWAYYDSVSDLKEGVAPSGKGYLLDSVVLKTGEHQEFYLEYKKRWKTLNSPMPSLGKVELLEKWAKADPEDVVAWMKQKKNELDRNEIGAILNTLMVFHFEENRALVQSILKEDLKLAADLQTSQLYTFGEADRIAEFKKRMELMPTGVAAKIDSLIVPSPTADPELLLDLVDYVESEKRQEISLRILSMHQRQFSPAQVERLKDKISSLEITDAEVQQLLQTLDVMVKATAP